MLFRTLLLGLLATVAGFASPSVRAPASVAPVSRAVAPVMNGDPFLENFETVMIWTPIVFGSATAAVLFSDLFAEQKENAESPKNRGLFTKANGLQGWLDANKAGGNTDFNSQQRW